MLDMNTYSSVQYGVELAPLTSFGCGGPAERLLQVDAQDLREVLDSLDEQPWVLGYGTNVLIADTGLPGTTLLLREGGFSIDERGLLIADSGAWWDDIVAAAVDTGWWGVELMSGIPGNVGAAVAGNIAAYGQAVSDRLAWVEVYHNGAVTRLDPGELDLRYRSSALQAGNLAKAVLLRAALQLQPEATGEVEYQSLLDTAESIGQSTVRLKDRREITLAARDRAGSLYHHAATGQHRSAGSFFKNPPVTQDQAQYVTGFDESGRSREQVAAQNRIHGGDSARVPAALVMLAAGFRRGQEFGSVRLHPRHVLKLENTGAARAQDIYNVAHHIMTVVEDKLHIKLEPEVRFLGEFESAEVVEGVE